MAAPARAMLPEKLFLSQRDPGGAGYTPHDQQICIPYHVLNSQRLFGGIQPMGIIIIVLVCAKVKDFSTLSYIHTLSPWYIMMGMCRSNGMGEA
jgi:hypothetical protein